MELPFSYQTPDFIQELTKVTFPGPPSNRIARSNGGKIANKPTAVSRNAARERTRVKSLRTAFQNLQRSLPYVPPNTKLSKLDVLILATTYISHLMKILNNQEPTAAAETEYPVYASCHPKGIRSKLWESSYLHPVKKWPMRSRLYAGVQEDPMNLSMEGYNHPFPTEVGRKRRGLSL